MTSYLMDSDWIIECLEGGDPDKKALIKTADKLYTSAICVAEILEGIRGSKREKQRRKQLKRFLDGATVLSFDRSKAEPCARIRDELRKKGNCPNDVDLFIGATAHEKGIKVLTENKDDFKRMPGVKVEDS